MNDKKFCPFKKITERSYRADTGKVTFVERFAPCAKGKCMAYDSWDGVCRRLEPEVKKK